MGHISVFRAILVWGFSVFLIMGGIAYAVNDPEKGLTMAGLGFLIMILNKMVFRVRKVQLEIDADEKIKEKL